MASVKKRFPIVNKKKTHEYLPRKKIPSIFFKSRCLNQILTTKNLNKIADPLASITEKKKNGNGLEDGEMSRKSLSTFTFRFPHCRL